MCHTTLAHDVLNNSVAFAFKANQFSFSYGIILPQKNTWKSFFLLQLAKVEYWQLQVTHKACHRRRAKSTVLAYNTPAVIAAGYFS